MFTNETGWLTWRVSWIRTVLRVGQRVSCKSSGAAVHISMASLSGGGSPRPLPTLQPQFRRRCSHIKTPHQLLRETGNYYMHIVFLQCWHTLVHRPASLCIFFFWRGREGWKPPDKNKFCNRSSAARLSPTRSPLFPITSLSLSHWLSVCTTVVRPFWLSLAFFSPCTYSASQCANCFHVCMSAFFRDMLMLLLILQMGGLLL